MLKVLDWTTERFERDALDSPRLDAQVLLAHVLRCTRVQLYTSFDKPLATEELTAFRALIQRRLAGEPVAYLVGEQEFWSLPFTVSRAVLIPRGDTEVVIEVVLDNLADRAAPWSIADIGTGSGAIAVTLARELSAARVIAIDSSPEAAAIAGGNAVRNGVAERVEVRVGDLTAPLGGETVDVLVANLPYIPTDDLAELDAEVRAEPAAALDGGDDGLDLIRRLCSEAPARLRSGGLLVLEHGYDQADAVAAIVAGVGAFEPPELRRDLAGHPRVTHARLSAASGSSSSSSHAVR